MINYVFFVCLPRCARRFSSGCCVWRARSTFMFYFLLDFRFGGVPQFTVPRVLCCVVLVVCLCVRPVSLLTVRTFSEYCCHILGARGASRADAACGGHAQRICFGFCWTFGLGVCRSSQTVHIQRGHEHTRTGN